MKVLAIDASSKSTGIAIFQDEKLIHYQCIVATDGNSFKRIIKMKNRILEIYKKYKPTNIVMEDVLPYIRPIVYRMFSSILQVIGVESVA